VSTKIYNAFRVKKSVDFWSFLWRVRDTARENVKVALKAHYHDLVNRTSTDSPEYKAARAKSDAPEHSVRLSLARDLVRKGFRENVTRLERDTYSLEVSIAVYPHKGRYYLRTFCEPCSVVGTVLDFVEQLPELEEYHYQNQTDRPEEVSPRDWSERKRVWNEIVETDNGVGSHVALDILSWSGFYLIDPWLDLAREWHDNPPTLPNRGEVWAGDLRALKALRNEKVTVEPGTIQSSKFRIARQEDGSWLVNLKHFKPRKFPTLDRAADRVWFEFQPESTKEWVRRTQKEAKERRRAEKQAKRS
jgi:hypothetical protein